MFPCPRESGLLARLLSFCTNYILKGPALPLILLPQFQCFGATRAQASSGGTLLSIYRQRGYQREKYCLASLLPLDHCFLGLLPPSPC